MVFVEHPGYAGSGNKLCIIYCLTGVRVANITHSLTQLVNNFDRIISNSRGNIKYYLPILDKGTLHYKESQGKMIKPSFSCS